MKSVRCLINRPYLENIIKQYSWVSILICGLYLVNSILGYSNDNIYSIYLYFLLSYIIIFTIPILLFRNTSSSNNASYMLSLPIKRNQYFVTTYIAGLLLISLPILFMYCILFFLNIFDYTTEYSRFLVITILLLFSYYHFSLLACQLAESTLMKGVLTIAFAVLPAIIYYFYQIALTRFTISFSASLFNYSFWQLSNISPLVYAIRFLSNAYYVIDIAILPQLLMIVVCFGLSYGIFVKKSFESLGGLISNSKIGSVIKYIFVSSIAVVLFSLSSMIIDIKTFSIINRLRYFGLLLACVFLISIMIEVLFTSLIKYKKIIMQTLIISILLFGAFFCHGRYLDYQNISALEVYDIDLNLSNFSFYVSEYGDKYVNRKEEINQLAIDFIKDILDSPEHLRTTQDDDTEMMSIYLYSYGQSVNRYYYVDQEAYHSLLKHEFINEILVMEYQYLLDICDDYSTIYVENHQLDEYVKVLDTKTIKSMLSTIDVHQVIDSGDLFGEDYKYINYTFFSDDHAGSVIKSNYLWLNYLSHEIAKQESLYNGVEFMQCYWNMLELSSIEFNNHNALVNVDFIDFEIEGSILEDITYAYIYGSSSVVNNPYYLVSRTEDSYLFRCEWYLESSTNIFQSDEDDVDSYNMYADVEIEFKKIDGQMKLIRFEIVGNNVGIEEIYDEKAN